MKPFWSYVDVRGPDECWVWKSTLTTNGYGHYERGRRVTGSRMAHRYAWLETYGPIPSDKSVLHKCDNKPCCNPNHLFLGTQLDNMRDKMAKGRHVSIEGSKSGTAKLTDEKVLLIREDKRSYIKIGEDFDISPTEVCRIKKRLRWSHI